MLSVLALLDGLIKAVTPFTHLDMGSGTSKEEEKTVNKGLIDDHSTTNNKEGGFNLIEYHSGTVMGTIGSIIFLVVCLVALCACYRFCRKWSIQKHRLRGFENGSYGPSTSSVPFNRELQAFHQPSPYAHQHQHPSHHGAGSDSSPAAAQPGSWLSRLPAGQYEVTEAGLIQQHRHPALKKQRGSSYDHGSDV